LKLSRKRSSGTARPTSSTLTKAPSSPGLAFTGLLTANGIAISPSAALRAGTDGRGAWRDNVFIERLWRSVKYEEVYLRAYDSVGHARASLWRYLEF
jgi:putative transposase